MKLAAIICVRTNSQRLPNKPLCIYDEVTQKPNLQCIVERIKTSRYNPTIIIATSTEASDNPIVDLATSAPLAKMGVRFYRGDLNNVVARFDGALKAICNNADYVWRAMGDNPLIDVGLVDWRIDVLTRNQADVIRPILPEPTYAAQANIWSREAWDYCAKHSSGSLLEHPGEYLYENYGMFKTIQEPGPESVYYQPIRTELDTPEDLEFFRRVWAEYPVGQPISYHEFKKFDSMHSTYEILSWLSTRPDIVALNSHIQEKTHTSYLHGHHRARNFKCANDSCGYTIATKINDALEVICPKCGTNRRFYP